MTCEVLDIHPPPPGQVSEMPCLLKCTGPRVHVLHSVSQILSLTSNSLSLCVCYEHLCVYVCAYTCVCVYTCRGQRPAQDVFLVILIFKTRSFAKLGVS